MNRRKQHAREAENRIPAQRSGQRLKRLFRRHPWSRRALTLTAATAGVLLVLIVGTSLTFAALRRDTLRVPEVEIAAPPVGTAAPEPTESPDPTPSLEPSESPEPGGAL